jgi:3-oxoacyl-[acyl-carrier protein] reductase
VEKMNGEVVLVTGSSRGIGASIAKAFAGEGATVVVNYVQNQEAADEVVREIEEKGGDAWAIQADVSSREDVQQMIAEIELEAGKLDIVVNNAFKPYPFDPENRKYAWEVTWEDYEEQINGSLKAVTLMSEAVLPLMKKRQKGSLINIVTNLIADPVVPYHEYTTAKAAIMGYTRNLAADVGAFGIRVNNVAPGLVYPTSSSVHTKEPVREKIISQTPLKRLARPEDIAGPVMFLASDWSRFMTGQTIYVDGGLVMN